MGGREPPTGGSTDLQEQIRTDERLALERASAEGLGAWMHPAIQIKRPPCFRSPKRHHRHTRARGDAFIPSAYPTPGGAALERASAEGLGAWMHPAIPATKRPSRKPRDVIAVEPRHAWLPPDHRAATHGVALPEGRTLRPHPSNMRSAKLPTSRNGSPP
ncbi:hypothetical protein EDF74_0299 [Stenotrophomonas rhizophila]|nr:hypothetical protein EDF74_0299 [Stenotrophomonas rhizophila]